MRPAFAFAAALVLASAAACGGGDGGLVTATIVVVDDAGGRAELTVELARTPAERSRGLSLRNELPEDGGMLFVYPEETESAFWMKDTFIPLSIAFIAEGGAILDIQAMEPLSVELHRPPGPFRYGLEVNQGWFGRNGFEVGDRVDVPEAVAAAAGE
jgi:uncharacterized membrane protein (UPF0127 family)